MEPTKSLLWTASFSAPAAKDSRAIKISLFDPEAGRAPPCAATLIPELGDWSVWPAPSGLRIACSERNRIYGPNASIATHISCWRPVWSACDPSEQARPLQSAVRSYQIGNICVLGHAALVAWAPRGEDACIVTWPKASTTLMRWTGEDEVEPRELDDDPPQGPHGSAWGAEGMFLSKSGAVFTSDGTKVGGCQGFVLPGRGLYSAEDPALRGLGRKVLRWIPLGVLAECRAENCAEAGSDSEAEDDSITVEFDEGSFSACGRYAATTYSVWQGDMDPRKVLTLWRRRQAADGDGQTLRGAFERIAGHEALPCAGFAFAPDGGGLGALVRRDGECVIWSVEGAASGGQPPAAARDRACWLGPVSGCGVVWSPDGRYVLVRAFGGDCRWTLWRRDGSRVEPLPELAADAGWVAAPGAGEL